MSNNAGDRIIAVLLAAGESSRFGRLKQIEPVAGETALLDLVVGEVLRCAAFDSVVLVLGAGADNIMDALGRRANDGRLDIVVNEDYAKGMSTSLRAGLDAARRGGCDAVAFLLGDMPLIDHRILDTMIAQYRSSDRPLCYAKAGDHPGHPIIVRKDLFDEFMAVEGDIGGREVVRKHIDSALEVDVDTNGVDHQLDIDDKDDLFVYRSLRGGRHAS